MFMQKIFTSLDRMQFAELIASCKEIEDRLGFQISGTGFQSSSVEYWILDSNQ